MIQFQIVAAGGVQDDAVRRVFDLDGAQVQQGRALRLVNILQQGPRGAGGQGQFGATQPFQLADLILLLDKAGRRVSLETPGGAGHDVLAQVAAGLFQVRVFGDQEFDGPQAMQLVHHGSEAFGLGEGEAAIGEVEAGDALLRGAGVDADQQVVGPGFQQALLRHGAGRHDAGHLAGDRAFRQGWVADLLAYRHRFAQPDQLGQVRLHSVKRHAGHGDGLAFGGFAPGGQGDVQQPGRFLGVLEKQLVEIAHAKEQQVVRVLGLEAQVLLNDWRVGGGFCGHDLILVELPKIATQFKAGPGLILDQLKRRRSRGRARMEAA